MILALSTSSPMASVAAIARDGRVLWAGSREAPRAAGGACLTMIQEMMGELGVRLAEFELFVADMGPGSFTGTRVGVILAKTLAYSTGRKVAGVSAFDLISADEVVVLPSKKGEYFVRVPGSNASRTSELPGEPFVGYGPGIEPQRHPLAEGVAKLLDRFEPMSPVAFAPKYLIVPSISRPKQPYRSSEGVDG